MDESDPTFNTDPSSRATRARALACVFTTSNQSTTVFADAEIVFAPRAILTAGITRETSPALWPGVSGAARVSLGMHSSADKLNAKTQACGDFIFFIEGSPELIAVTTFVTGAPPWCQFEFPRSFPPATSTHALFRPVRYPARLFSAPSQSAGSAKSPPSGRVVAAVAGMTDHCLRHFAKDFFRCFFP